jgi:hypothetical protein
MATNIKITVLGGVTPCSLLGRFFHDVWSIRYVRLFWGKLLPSSLAEDYQSTQLHFPGDHNLTTAQYIGDLC